MTRRDLLKLGALGVVGGCCSCAGIRMGTLPWRAGFPDVSNLGKHGFGEKGGQVYTLDAGPIDVNHARIVVDDARRVYGRVRDKLVNRASDISFKVGDSARYSVSLDYPDGFSDGVAGELAIDMAGYFSYVDSVWHEVRGWYGKDTIPFISDFASAFSCEDNVSNALGVNVFGVAMRDKTRGFSDAVGVALENELKRLDARDGSVGRAMSKYTKGPRHFDIGLEKGFLVPWNVPGVESKAYKVPSLMIFSRYDIDVDWKMSDGSGEGKKAFRSIGAKGGIDEVGLCDIVGVIEKGWGARNR